MQEIKLFFRRRMALLLACVMVLSMMPVTAFAAQTPTEGSAAPAAIPDQAMPMSDTYSEGGVEYTLYDDHAEVTDYDGSVADVVVLAEVEGLPVTVLKSSAFAGHWGTFTSIVLPEGLTTIEDSSFSWCSTLRSVTIPESVTTLGENTFLQCGSLTGIDLPDGLTTLGEGVFYGCDALTSIDFPDSLTTIGRSAFGLCTGLTSVIIPAEVTEIGLNAFESCTNLHTVTVSSQNRVYSSKDGILYRDAGTRLVWCPAGRSDSVSIPSGVVAIEPNAFFDCEKLTSVTIPAGVTSIGSYAFYNCDGLTSVTIPGGVASIGSNAFYSCSGLASVTILDGVAAIGDYAFGYCGNLTSIDIPESVASIGWGVFCECSSLLSLDWPGASSSIPGYAMEFCSSLKTLTIPHSVTQIGYGATLGCYRLADVYYDGTRAEWSQVSIDSNNTGVYNATIHFNDGTTSNDPEPHDTLDTLTELDYLAFSELAYDSLTANVTVKEFLKDQWEKKWNDIDLTYGDVYGSVGNWRIKQFTYNNAGFYAAVFVNDANQAVISYRGSKPLNGENYPELLKPGTDIFYDWILNDLAMQVCDAEGTQLESALSLYNGVVETRGTDNVVVTGHSLGGGLANLVSAYSGSKAVTVNAISVLDAAYSRNFSIFGKAFQGVDTWDIYDQVNCYDVLAGMYEYWQDGMKISQLTKPYEAHMSRYELSDVAANHSIASIVTTDAKGKAALTSVVGSFKPTKPITQKISEITISDIIIPGDMFFDNFSYLDLGTTSNDVFRYGLAVISPRVSYGGDGVDNIAGAVMTDVIIGGPGPDDLDGSYGDDMYVYYKGDGHDEIRDISGDDAICLYGFADDDVIEVIYDGNTVDLKCNGERFISIYDYGRAYDYFTLDSFAVYIKQSSGIKKVDITEYFSTRKYGSHIVIACPVDVEVLDAEGNVVHTLKDGEVSTSYTDYGNFYVFEEEDGGYGKVLDLVEGYTARIVGAGEGTMDVTYQVPVDGVLTDPVSVTEVPVSDTLIATIEEDENNNVYLVIDADGDGAADEQLLLEAEHVHEWDEGTVTKEATCTESGEITYACSGCEETDVQILDATGHSYDTVVTAPTCTEQGYTTYTCAVCGDSYVSDYVDAGHSYVDGTCTGCGKVETIVTYTQASISLAGDIGVNYYVRLSTDIVADEGAYMQFTVAGQTQTVPLNEAEVSDDGTYRFSCKVAAKQMTDAITGQMYLSDGTAVGDAKVYSVKAYCDAAISVYSQYEAYADLVALMEAMLNYGGYSQTHFGYNTDNLANADLDLPLPVPTEEDVSFYANYAQGSEDGISVSSASLLLESTTTIRFYFQLDGSKSIDEYTFYVDGQETAPVQVSENQYYVDKVNVAARDLDHMATVTVGGLTVRYCGLSYVRQVAVLTPDYYSEDLVNVAKALYAYNQAANAYFA